MGRSTSEISKYQSRPRPTNIKAGKVEAIDSIRASLDIESVSVDRAHTP